jgi:hypothetical protein
MITIALNFPKDHRSNPYYNIRTLSDYYLINNIYSAPLFVWGEYKELRYTESYSHSPDFKDWEIRFKPEFKSAKGASYTGEHWVNCINKSFEHSLGVHFNPRQSLAKKVEWDKSSNTARVSFKKPEIDGLQFLGRPEAAIVCSETLSGEFDGFGPYYLKEATSGKLILEKNPNFPEDLSKAPQNIELVDLSQHKNVKADLYLEKPTSENELKSHCSKDVFTMTYFLRLNDGASSIWKNKNDRHSLANTLQSISLDNLNEFKPAKYIIPPGKGQGRLTSFSYEESSGSAQKEFSIATVKSPKLESLLDRLQQNSSYKIKTKSFDSYADLFGAYKDFDAILINNDFCGEDPYGAFYNAFNPDRPLFAVGDKRLEEKFFEQDRLAPVEERDAFYKALHNDLLEEAFNIPLAYSSQQIFYDASKLDMREQIELSFWTIYLAQSE